MENHENIIQHSEGVIKPIQMGLYDLDLIVIPNFWNHPNA